MRARSSCTPASASCARASCAPPASSSAAGSTASTCSSPWAQGTALNRKYDLSFYLPGFHQLQRIDCLREREGLRYVGLQLALAEPLAELADALGEGLRFAAREIAPEHADDGAAFQQREVERDLRDIARGETDHQQAAAPGA